MSLLLPAVHCIWKNESPLFCCVLMGLTCLIVDGNFHYVQCDQLDLRYINYLQYIWISCDVIILMILLFLNFAVILLALEIICKRLFTSFFALHHASRIHMPAPIMETRNLSLDVAARKHTGSHVKPTDLCNHDSDCYCGIFSALFLFNVHF